ncbi:hypothetical protein SHAb15599_00018 [Acinetobacter phage SH-Ab 15599]|nr:hypothetical protein SHAb15599_00018 [Acinetobacter phage SH-Ab 15599]
MSKLIVLCGERNTGKDFLTQAVTNHMKQYGIRVHRLSFSDEVRRIAYNIFPFLKDVPEEKKNDPIYGEPNNPYNYSWRDIIKAVGRMLRDVDPAIFAKKWWTNQGQRVVDGTDKDIFFVTDMRTQNEYDLIEAEGTLDDVTFVKLVSDTGLPPDDFEAWTRDFQGDFLFKNERDEASAKSFCEIVEGFIQRPNRANSTMIAELLTIQDELNNVYSGDTDWLSQASLSKYATAADREFSEFLDEISTHWAWWKPDTIFDVNKAMVEFCDFICFRLSTFLIKFSTSEHDLDYSALFDYVKTRDFSQEARIKVDYDGWYKIIKTEGFDLNNDNLDEAILGLMTEINVTLDMFDLDLAHFHSTMIKVFERNRERGKKLSAGLPVDKQNEQAILTV